MIRSRTRATIATARTRIPTLGPKGERAAGAHAAPIARRLAILVIVTILPVLAFSAYMIANYSQAQRAIYMQQFQATTRATSLAIDAEIARQKAILETLRASAELKNHDWRGFYDFAKAAIGGRTERCCAGQLDRSIGTC